MQALDDFVSTARSKNNQYHESHVQSLQGLSATVRNSYSNIGNHFTATYERVRGLGDEMSAKTDTIREALDPLDATLRQPLAGLRSHIGTTLLQEYTPTGETPQKGQYNYPTELPRTQAHETLLAALRRPGSAGNSATSPSKTIPVLNDTLAPIAGDDDTVQSLSISLVPGTAAGLREIDANIISAGPLSSNADAAAASSSLLASLNSKPPSLLKRSTAGSGIKPPQRLTKKAPVVALEGRENAMLNSTSSQSIGRRRSPRIG
jgi:kinesin family member 11